MGRIRSKNKLKDIIIMFQVKEAYPIILGFLIKTKHKQDE
jgi:hypothetical protein